MTLRVAKLHARLLLEGIEIPIVSFQVSGTPNQTSVATIQIVPTPMAHRLLNRTKVDLFFWDLYAYEEAAQSRVAMGASSGDILAQDKFFAAQPESQEAAETRMAAGGITPPGGETTQSIQIPSDLLRYRLLFTGEVVGISYVKRSMDRGVILQCVGNSSYWDLVAADRRGGQLFGGGRMARAAGLTQGPLWDLLRGSTGQVFDKLSTPPSMFPEATGFTAGVLHLMESIFGVYSRRTRKRKSIAAANQFMALAEIRLKLLQQVGVPGGDDGPLKMIKRRLGSIWAPALRGLPRYFSFRQLLQSLMPYTFYEHTPILAPHYVPPTGAYAAYDNYAGYTTGPMQHSTQWSWITDIADNITSSVAELKLEMGDISAQVAESGASDAAEFSSLPTDIKQRMARIRFLCTRILEKTTETVTITEEYNPALDSIVEQLDEPGIESQPERYAELSRRLLEVQSRPLHRTRETQRGFAGLEPVANWTRSIDNAAKAIMSRVDSGRSPLPDQPDDAITSRLNQISEWAAEIHGHVIPPERSAAGEEDAEPAHLYCDILRPDVWFCAPPRSNVIFPDHVTSMQYNRVFSNEATRLLVRMSDKLLGSCWFFDKWWIAPTAIGLFGNTEVMRSGKPMARIHKDLMDHELAGGVIPIFQSMSDRDMFIGADITGVGATDPNTVSVDQKRWFQQVTNFLLFKARFGARTMSIESRFNPYLVCGFPAVVLDAATDRTQTEINQILLNAARDALAGLDETSQGGYILELIRNRVGTHYMGVIQQLTHTASATGENSGTSVMLSYAREHNETIEYMGQDIIRTVQEAANRAQTRTVRTRTPAADRVMLNLKIAAEELNQYGGAFGAGATYTAGLIDERPRQAEFSFTGGTRIFAGGTYQDAQDYVTALMVELAGQPQGERQITIQAPTTRTLYVFALEPPVARLGTPAGPDGDPPATDDYNAGTYGPNGGEIISSVDVTEQYRNLRRRRNVSGISAEDRYIAEQVANREQVALGHDREHLAAAGIDPSDTTTNADVPAERVQDVTDVGELADYVAGNREIVAQYDAGWRQEFITLPFLNSVKTGRNKPATVITTDKVGIPVNVRDIPQLVAMIGTDQQAATMVTLKVYRITEDLQHLSNTVYNLAAEDILRPPWYSDDWTNGLIGNTYLKYFGTGSIVDPMAVLRPESINLFGEPEQVSAALIQMRQTIAYGDFTSGPAMAGVLEGSTIEDAVNFLCHTYSATKIGGYDVEAFIRNYTWRPIATMFDMFGSGDLQLDTDGNMALSGVEGFHSRAFGPYSNLFGLMPFNDNENFLGVDRNDMATSARVDIRGRRYALVQAYRIELLRLRGCSVG